MKTTSMLFLAALSATLLLLACNKPAAEKAEAAPAAPQAAAQPAPAPEAAPAAAEAASSDQPDRKVYVCEMGCEVSPEPGKCSKCGMTLKEVKASQISYTCGQCGYTAKEPGVCPHCKSELTFKLKR